LTFFDCKIPIVATARDHPSTIRLLIMSIIKVLSSLLLLLAGAASALSLANGGDRRAFVQQATSTFLVAAASTTSAGCAVSAFPGIVVAADDADPYADFVATESGLRYKVTKEGGGTVPAPGQTVKAHYTGWLDGFDEGGRKFDSSRDRNRPFTFKVGAGQVIRGWDEAFSTMKVGERRQIILPPRLAYGDRGAGGIIPGGATLYFDVELLGIL
jgi:peptidylprolyl isomerase